MRTPVLRAQFSTALVSDAKWNLLLPRGTYHGANLAPVGGSITIDDALLAEMVGNWQAAGSPPLPVRKTHRHLDEDVPAKDRGELEKAFGFLTSLRVTADGLEALTEWNPAGKATVAAREFAFWSPEWQPKHRDRRTGELRGWWLSGTALTNDPFFNEMPPVAASADTETTDPNPQHQEKHMNEEQMKALRAALGLPADATPEQILAAQSKLTASAKSAHVTLTAADVQSAVETALEPLKASLKAEQEKSAVLSASLLERDLDRLIADKKRGDGKLGRALVDEKVKPVLIKLVAAEGSTAEGLKSAADYLDAIPCTITMQAVGIEGSKEVAVSASSAHEKLTMLANDLAAKGTKAPMEVAMATHPELAAAARSLTTSKQN